VCHEIDKFRDDIIKLAKIFELQDLVTLIETCEKQTNVEMKISFVNNANGESNDIKLEYANICRKNLVNQNLLSDVTFKIQAKEIYGHRAIISGRCDVLKDMMTWHYSSNTKAPMNISNINYESFMHIMEYFYTDSVNFGACDDIPLLLEAADILGLQPLIAMCELEICKIVENATIEEIQNGIIDVVELIRFAQMHMATQLETYCTHYVMNHYKLLDSQTVLRTLPIESIRFVEDHQWPPVEYIRTVKEYKNSSYCNIL